MTNVNIPDDELVSRTLDGNPEAYNVLIERYTPTVYRIVRRMCSDRAEAEAITQEAFLRAWESLPLSKTDRLFRPWVVQIAVNAARDALKKTRPLDFADLPGGEVPEIVTDDPDLEERLEEAEAVARLAAAVQTLPAHYRMAIALRYEAEMTYREIASALGLPINTVRTHLRRAKQKLRDVLEKKQ
jgi:RNA polymerase sigma-70 factor (ECF subfamily)